MSGFQHKNGSFSLFKNAKDGNEARPDYYGDGVDLGGNPIKVAAWIKEGKAGKFMSCTMQLKNDQQVKKKPLEEDRAFTDDTLPF